ncbi:hypothetical protein WHR41_09174 [Cladosporium halotolerans]|uniref:Succinate dehydrogenase subunit C n=1 Tax=Cladosporium halotolerans TaxID=1052096 RepID=A0AB34KGK1_9PEZI
MPFLPSRAAAPAHRLSTLCLKQATPSSLIAPRVAFQRTPPRPAALHTARSPRTNPNSAPSLLAAQRLRRPLTPHLSIYRPQMTSVLSVLERLTGLALSGTLYLFPMVYLTSPSLGFEVSATSVAAAVGGMSPWVKMPVKFVISWVFAFHGFNALRFLAWKSAWGITNRQVARSGWVIIGASIAGAAALTGLGSETVLSAEESGD